MAKSGSKLFLFLSLLGVWWCCTSLEFSDEWRINMKSTPSSNSRYFILHDWQDTYSKEMDISPLPAAKISDIMLKTMGILRDGAGWPGVVMGNLFSRPLATAMFIIDGLSPESSFKDLSTTSFGVDQTGLSGCTCGDIKLMFGGDNVARHLSDLFDQNSQTDSVSANTMAAQTASANGAFTSEERLRSIIQDIQSGGLSLSHYGLETAAKGLVLTNEIDAEFIAELVLIKQTIEQLKELKSYVNDLSPDVFIFTVSTLQNMEYRYGVDSTKMGIAIQLVQQVIRDSNKVLVEIYNGQVLVQALVMEWNHPAVDKSSHELEWAYHLLRPYLIQEDKDAFIALLPRVVVKDTQDNSLCGNLKDILSGSQFYAFCSKLSVENNENIGKIQSRTRRKRDVVDNIYETEESTRLNTTIHNLAESRSSAFSAVFLITLFVTISLGLSVYVVSCVLWNMDPGRDSIIYRQVSDPTIRTQ